jgi:hypothetical protein
MAFSLSPREDYLACLSHKPHEHTPGQGDGAGADIGFPIERGEGGAGIDAFGVRWVAPLSGGPGAFHRGRRLIPASSTVLGSQLPG